MPAGAGHDAYVTARLRPHVRLWEEIMSNKSNTKKTASARSMEKARQSLIKRAAAREAEWFAQMTAIASGHIPAGEQIPDNVPFLPPRPRLYGNRTWSPYPTAQRSSVQRVRGDEFADMFSADEGMSGLDCGSERDEEDEQCFGDEAKLSLSEAHWLENHLRDEALAELEELAIDQEFIKNFRFFGKLKQRPQPKVRAGEWLDPKSKVVAISYDWKGKACKAVAVNPKREFKKLRKAAAQKANEVAKPVTVVEPEAITLVTPTVNATPEPAVEVAVEVQTKAFDPLNPPLTGVYHKAGEGRVKRVTVDAFMAATLDPREEKLNAAKAQAQLSATPVVALEPEVITLVAPEDIIEEVPEMPPPLPVVAAAVPEPEKPAERPPQYFPAPRRLRAMTHEAWLELQAEEEAARQHAVRTSVA